MKLCECGCGNAAPLAKYTDKRYNHKKGEPIRFINGHWSRLQPRGKDSPLYGALGLKGDKNPAWNGGVSNTADGRNLIRMPEHSRSQNNGYVLQSVFVAEQVLGKGLPKGAVTHHVDGNANNDKKNNLVICENNAYHHFLHQRKRAHDACGHANWRKCWICKIYDMPSNLYIRNAIAYHQKCKNEYNRNRYAEKKSMPS